MAKPMQKPPKSSGVTPVPAQWVQSLSIRPPDFRALIATWTDPVTRRKGLGIYEEMLADPQVVASMDLLKYAALSLEWNISAQDDEDKSQVAVAEEVDDLLKNWPGSLSEFLYHVLSALDYGFSITELTWESEDGVWRPTDWVSLPQALYGFTLDPNTARVKAVRTYFAPMQQGEDYPLEGFVILRWNSRYNAPYGRSQLMRAYEPWWMKQLLRRMRNTALDRFGVPLLGARVPPNTPDVDRKRLKQFLEELHAEAGLVFDNTYEVLPLTTGQGQAASEGFQRAIEYEDAQIAKAITGVSLNANESRGAGTYAQARVHQDNFLYWVNRVRQALESVIQEQIINRYVAYNHGLSAKDAPRISIQSPEGRDIQMAIQSLTAGSQLGLVVPHLESGWMREELGFPAPSEEVLAQLKQQADLQQQQKQAELQMQQAQAQSYTQPQQPDTASNDSPDEDWGQASWLRGYAAMLERHERAALQELTDSTS